MALLYPSVTVSHGSVTMRQPEHQDPEIKAAKWNSAFWSTRFVRDYGQEGGDKKNKAGKLMDNRTKDMMSKANTVHEEEKLDRNTAAY